MIQPTYFPKYYNNKFLLKTTFWAVTEVWLTFLGMDDLADYSEFLLSQYLALSQKNYKPSDSSTVIPIFCEQINETCPVKATHIQPNSCSIENDYFYSYPTFKHKCLKVKNFCVKAEVLSQII